MAPPGGTSQVGAKKDADGNGAVNAYLTLLRYTSQCREIPPAKEAGNSNTKH